MKIIISFFCLLTVLALYSCKKDNYSPPGSMLSGKVVYQGQALGVRTNGVQLELWQHGYQLFTKIPVYIDQSGTYSAALFDGDYKLVLLKGNGPWLDNTDSIDVHVSGATAMDVQVQPYFIIKNESYQKGAGSVTASCKVDSITGAKKIERATLYISTTQFADANNNAAKADLTGAAISNLSQPLNFNVALPASLGSRDYVYARIGVKTTGVGELVYTQVKKIDLK